MRLSCAGAVLFVCCFWNSIAHSTEITVATLNIGHGRGGGGHQILLSDGAIEDNILHIGRVAQERALDVLAVQEADVHAWWSGYHNQIQTLADLTEMPYSIEGVHSKRSNLRYGTSLLSRTEWTQHNSLGYKSSFVLPPKGFVYGVLVVAEQSLLIVSVHLDPLRSVVREKQIQSLVSVVDAYGLPTIIMGDLNVEWGGELQQYCQLLHVVPYQPEMELSTFVSLDKRFDWILLSPSISFLTYETLEDRISDHRMVVATLFVPTPN